MSELPVPTSTTLTPGAISLPSFGPYFLVLANVAVANRGATVAAVTPRAIADLRFILFMASSLNLPCTDKHGCAILAYSNLNLQNGAANGGALAPHSCFCRNFEWQLAQSCRMRCRRCSAGILAGSDCAAPGRLPSRLPPSIGRPTPIRMSVVISSGALQYFEA